MFDFYTQGVRREYLNLLQSKLFSGQDVFNHLAPQAENTSFARTTFKLVFIETR
jgi:hypothetical protein